jgi:hypothetical protein
MLYIACATAASAVESNRTLIQPYTASVTPMLANLRTEAGQCMNAKIALATSTAPVQPVSVAVCQAVGGVWIRRGNQLAVRVASIVIPEEFNVLLNPNRAEYKALAWSTPRPFHFDPRLFVAEPRIL